MRRKALALCTAIFLAFAAAPEAQRGAAGPVTAIVGARLVDGTGAAAVNDSVILVSGDRITAAGPRASVQVPQGATVVNASGKTVIPGLIDVHCHLNQPEDVMRKLLPVALNWGVTTIRMTGNDKPEIMHVYTDAQGRQVSVAARLHRRSGIQSHGSVPGRADVEADDTGRSPQRRPGAQGAERRLHQDLDGRQRIYAGGRRGDRRRGEETEHSDRRAHRQRGAGEAARRAGRHRLHARGARRHESRVHRVRKGEGVVVCADARSGAVALVLLRASRNSDDGSEVRRILRARPRDAERSGAAPGDHRCARLRAAEAAFQGQQLSVHQDDVRRGHPHRHRHRLRRRGVADHPGRPHDASGSAHVRRGGDDARATRCARPRSMPRVCSSARKIPATDRSRPARLPIWSC